MQLVAHLSGGEVIGAGRREYGRAELQVEEPQGLFDGFEPRESMTVWMSHGDHVDAPPPGYVVTASSASVADRRHAAPRQADPLRAVPPRGRAHAARRRDHLELPLPDLSRDAELDAGRVRRGARSRRSAQLVGDRARHLRTVRRRRLVGRRGARAPRDRRPAHLRLRRHGTAAPARARAGRAHVQREPRHQARHGRRVASAFSTRSPASRIRRRSGAIIGHTFIDVFEEATSGAGKDADVPRAGHALSRRDRVVRRRAAARR